MIRNCFFLVFRFQEGLNFNFALKNEAVICLQQGLLNFLKCLPVLPYISSIVNFLEKIFKIYIQNRNIFNLNILKGSLN